MGDHLTYPVYSCTCCIMVLFFGHLSYSHGGSLREGLIPLLCHELEMVDTINMKCGHGFVMMATFLRKYRHVIAIKDVLPMGKMFYRHPPLQASFSIHVHVDVSKYNSYSYTSFVRDFVVAKSVTVSIMSRKTFLFDR